MIDRKKVYKSFVNKPVFILTNSDFKYHTENLQVLEEGIFFKDKFGEEIFIKFEEIKFIQNVK